MRTNAAILLLLSMVGVAHAANAPMPARKGLEQRRGGVQVVKGKLVRKSGVLVSSPARKLIVRWELDDDDMLMPHHLLFDSRDPTKTFLGFADTDNHYGVMEHAVERAHRGGHVAVAEAAAILENHVTVGGAIGERAIELAMRLGPNAAKVLTRLQRLTAVQDEDERVGRPRLDDEIRVASDPSALARYNKSIAEFGGARFHEDAIRAALATIQQR